MCFGSSIGIKASSPRTLCAEELESRRLLALNPTADEQYFMQLLNRFRTDPAGEFSRLISRASPIQARDPILQDDLEFANVNGNTLRTELSRLTPTHPVAWNEAIRDFNIDHNQDMIQRGSHYHSNTTARRNELIAAGVNFRIVAGEKINSEVVFGYGRSVLHTFASYVIDWQRGGPGGMVSGRSHRVALHNPDFDQAGAAFRNHNGTTGNPPLGPKVHSSILANIEQPPIFVTGAIFRDSNSNGWYDPGEGRSSVRFTFTDQDGNEFETTGFGTGGYQIALPPGTYQATATGGGMRYTQRMSNIVVGTQNVWQNWIYDPDVIPPDLLESNNSRGGATILEGDQTFTELGIHSSTDQDFFRLRPIANGTGNFRINFSHSVGDLRLNLLDSAGNVIAFSDTNGNIEEISHGLVRNQIYYLQVLGNSGATHHNYRLTTNQPDPSPAILNSDRAVYTGAASSLQIHVLGNDSNPDGSATAMQPSLVQGTDSAFSVNSNRRVVYSAPEGFSGVHRARYTVTNEHDLVSQSTGIEVFVLDFSDETPWQNNSDALDVNDDSTITPLDALLAINAINNAQNSQLPTSASGANAIFGFVDSSGDGFITAIDILAVINRLNGGSGEGEQHPPTPTQPFGPQGDTFSSAADATFYEIGRRKDEENYLNWNLELQ